MPLPTPSKNEEKNTFIPRCLHEIKNDKWKNHKQQIAICLSIWNQKYENLIIKINNYLKEIK